MYSNSIITTLASKIGFGAMYSEPGFTLDASYTGTADGRKVTGFHTLVTTDNLYKCLPKPNMSKVEFEAELHTLRINAAKTALARVLDQNQAYIDEFDYDLILTAKMPLLEEVVGNLIAISGLEILIGTERSNLQSINADLTEAKLKFELNGYKTDKGVIVAVGLQGKVIEAVQKATKVIFKNKVKIKGDSRW